MIWCHHAQDGLKIVTIETLSRVASTECHHAQDGLKIVTIGPTSRVASTECHHAQDGLRLLLLEPPQGWLVLNAIMPKTVLDCYYWNHLKGGWY